MTDREMLEMAAKAAGYEVRSDGEGGLTIPTRKGASREWNPLTDDGDALRLAVHLGMNIDIGFHPVGFTCALVISGSDSVIIEEYHDDNAMAATRRSIVRAAAQIGAQM